MSEGVEWALHCCIELSRVDQERAVPAGRLAALYGLPPAYLNKQLQALGRAGIVSSAVGPRGGFRLARPPSEITLLDVVVAIEGAEPAFQCADITHRGHAGTIVAKSLRGRADRRVPCAVSQAMRFAELTWRRHLAARTVAEVRVVAEGFAPTSGDRIRDWLTTPSPPTNHSATNHSATRTTTENRRAQP